MKKITIGIVLVCVIFLSTGYVKKDNALELSKNLNIFSSLVREVDKLYVDTIEVDKVVNTGIKSLLESLDPYTIYYPEGEQESLELMTSGSYAGIGSTIAKKNDKIIIRQPYTHSPSQLAGLLPGDTIASIDDNSVANMGVKEVSELLKGEKGDSLSITINRKMQKEPLTFTLARNIIQFPSIPYSGMLNDSIGYLYLSSFTTHIAEKVKQTITNLEEKGAKSIVFDLRNNGGGLLDQAVDILGLFLPKNSHIVTIKGKNIKKDFYTKTAPLFPNMRIAVLVNSSTASASEIVSGSLQDYDRAVILGERSFGKGLVQTIFDLPYKGKLKLTTAKYYIPSGRCIQAIDYSHRNEDGSVGKVPDSLVTSFTTKNGRIVYDGGGILPDVLLNKKKYASVVEEIIQSDKIFDFVSQYALTHKDFPAIQEFKMTDELYNDFKSFLETNNFTYQTASQKIIDSLITVSKKEKLYDKNKKLLDNVKQQFSHSLARDMENFKEDIKELIAYEFIIRYYNNEGAIAYRARVGEQIKEAQDILANSSKYTTILSEMKE